MSTITLTATKIVARVTNGDTVVLPAISSLSSDWYAIIQASSNSDAYTITPSGSDKIENKAGNYSTSGGLYGKKLVASNSSWFFISSFDLRDFTPGAVTYPVISEDVSVAGISLDEDNTWSGVQSFEHGTFKLKDADGTIVNILAESQSVNRTLQIPALAGDGYFICSFRSGNQFIYSATFFTDALGVSAGFGSEGVLIGANGTQTGQQVARFPVLTENSTIITGHSGTTSAMSGGTVTVTTANVHTGDLIIATRISGAGASTGITSYSIVNGVSFTLNGAATDDGVYAYLIIKP